MLQQVVGRSVEESLLAVLQPEVEFRQAEFLQPLVVSQEGQQEAHLRWALDLQMVALQPVESRQAEFLRQDLEWVPGLVHRLRRHPHCHQ